MSEIEKIVQLLKDERDYANSFNDWMKHISTLESGFIIASLALFQSLDKSEYKWLMALSLLSFVVSIAFSLWVSLDQTIMRKVDLKNKALSSSLACILLGFGFGVVFLVAFILINFICHSS